jgi:NAD(P)-dependent dehydrogenase (short-subunit alcohol dehydrogenase family)
MQLRVDGRRIVVTAGAAGIGRAIVNALWQAGARIHACDVDAAALAQLPKDFPGISTSLCDVSDPEAVAAMFVQSQAALCGLDALVNNAGIAGPTGPIEAIDIAAWQNTLAVNLSGQFYCARQAAPLLKAAGGGAIVNLSSAAGRFGYPLRAPYAASKWGVVGLSHTLAAELGPFGIRSNAVLPGPVEGPRMDAVIRAKAQARGIDFQTMKDSYLELTALRSFVGTEDVAGMVLYLISDAGRLISGQALGVDAGTISIR